jgi:hypothetical protein
MVKCAVFHHQDDNMCDLVIGHGDSPVHPLRVKETRDYIDLRCERFLRAALAQYWTHATRFVSGRPLLSVFGEVDE